jgi:selenocysteine lyase/cysteine desulfurase
MEIILREEQALTAHLLQGMAKIPGLSVHGIKHQHSPSFARKGGVIAFSIKGVMPYRIAAVLTGQEGIGIRTGCHCAHLLVKHILHVPPPLQKLQRVIVNLFPNIELPGVARISIGIGNSPEDADTFIRVLDKIVKQKNTPQTQPKPFVQDGNRFLSKKEIKQQMEEFVKMTERRIFIG